MMDAVFVQGVQVPASIIIPLVEVTSGCYKQFDLLNTPDV